METGFPGPIRCCGWTSTGADYGVRQGTTQKKEKTPLTWDSQHVHQDIQTVPRLEGKSNHVTRSSKLTHTHTNHTIRKEQQPTTCSCVGLRTNKHTLKCLHYTIHIAHIPLHELINKSQSSSHSPTYKDRKSVV